MIFLFLLCLARVESAVDFDSGGVVGVTELDARQIPKSWARAESDPRFDEPPDQRFHSESILTRLARSAHEREGPKSMYYSPLRRFARELLDSPWVYPPISKYLTAVVIPGLVINHGKVADLGGLSLIAISHRFANLGGSQTNLTIFHGNLITSYKYNLDGPKGRLEVRAPNRIYLISLSSKQEGSQCDTELTDLALEEEDELEFSAHGEASDEVNPHIKFVEYVLTIESRRTAIFNIEAAVKHKLQTVKSPICQDIQ